jgi:hypothetical protein
MRINPLNTAFGAFWTMAFTGSAAALYEDGSKYLKAKISSDEQTPSETKIAQARKRLILDGVSLGGTGASSIDWANSVSWIRIGKEILPIVSGIGHIATLTVSSAEVTLGLKEIYRRFFSEKKDQNTSDLQLTCLETAAHLNAIGWAALGVVSLAFGVIVFPTVTGIFFVGYMSFSGASIFYKIYYEN